MLIFTKRFLLLLLFGSLLTSLWHMLKPMPKGLAYESPPIPADSVTFLADLTYQHDGEKVQEQHIFAQAFRMIDAAEAFVVLDLFLFNDDYPRTASYAPLARELTDHLVQAAAQRGITVVLITDEINTFYGAYANPYLEDLKSAGVRVVLTDLSRLRDSNPLYSGFYRLVLAPFGVSQGRTLTNPFSVDAPKVSISALLRMLNFKANHRKLIVTEKAVWMASANPHDASSNHSNIALVVEGAPVVKAALEAEQAVLALSGDTTDLTALMPASGAGTDGLYTVRLLTESRIMVQMRQAVQITGPGDRIDIGVFYLSHRPLIKDLVDAARRGVRIRVILDPNKDAFGREKNGIPNRQTAQELTENGAGNIELRWYMTHGEQFHSKLMKIDTQGQTTLFGGSTNFTRRNFEDLNLEANLMITGPAEAPVFQAVDTWFRRIWTNAEGTYTGELSEYADDALHRVWLYRIMEATGLSTF